MNDQTFVDFYEVLQVDPGCSAKVLERAYHRLAKGYHPDHTGTTDHTKFNEVMEAYRALRDPEQRAAYDQLYRQHNRKEWFETISTDEIAVDEQSALDDADDHIKILMFLYKKRRESAQDAGVVGFYLQELLGCTDDHFDFHKWYLKEKGLVSITEHGTLAITVQGIDHVISMSRTTKAEKLLLGRSKPSQDGEDGFNLV